MSPRHTTFRPQAQTELLTARDWYEREHVGLGEAFAAEVEATLDLVLRSPKLFPVVHGEIRRAMVPRFPYGLFYRLTDAAIARAERQSSAPPSASLAIASLRPNHCMQPTGPRRFQGFLGM